ncbi:MAG: AMP-binding protein [Halanaeroarchaeum sp.]
METVGDVLDAGHPADDPALVTPRREYDYRRFRATADKTGNYLRHCGVGRGATVAVLDTPIPEAIFGFLGAGLLGGTVAFAPEGRVDAKVLLGPTGDLDDYAVEPGCKRIAVGEAPDDPSWAYFEREVWSENPFFPESPADPDGDLLPDWTQREAIAAAETLASDLSPADRVAIRGSLADPGTVVAGVLAPLVAGAAVVLPGADLEGTVAVGGDGPEARTLSLP